MGSSQGSHIKNISPGHIVDPEDVVSRQNLGDRLQRDEVELEVGRSCDQAVSIPSSMTSSGNLGVSEVGGIGNGADLPTSRASGGNLGNRLEGDVIDREIGGNSTLRSRVSSENLGDQPQRDVMDGEVGGNADETDSTPSSMTLSKNLGDREVGGNDNVANSMLQSRVSNENLGDQPERDVMNGEDGEVGRNGNGADSTARSRASSMSSLSTLSEDGDQPVVGVESDEELLDGMEVDGEGISSIDVDNSSHSPEFVNVFDNLDSSLYLGAPFELRRSARNANPKNQPTPQPAILPQSSSIKRTPAQKMDKNFLLVSVPINSMGKRLLTLS